MNATSLFFFVYNIAGADFIAPEKMSITLSALIESDQDCVMIMTVFDDLTSMDKLFRVSMLLSASTESESTIYMPSTTNITITNRGSAIKIV